MCRRLTIYEHLMMIGHGEVNQLCKGKVGTVLQSNCKIATEIYIHVRMDDRLLCVRKSLQVHIT